MKKGFTLIELLIVIAIIGILSSVIMASVNNVQDNDGKPKCDTYQDLKISDVPARCFYHYN